MKRTLFTKVIKKRNHIESKFWFEELEPDDNRNQIMIEPDTDDKSDEVNTEREELRVEKRVDIDEIINQIKSEYEAKLAEAYQRGFREAEAILEGKMNEKLKEQIMYFEQMLKNFSNEVESFGQKIEIIVISLAVEIAKKIVKREIEMNDDFIVNQVKEAIKRVVGVEKIRLRINPEDEKLIKELKPELLQIADSTRDIIVESDSSIDRGGCIIESELGNVDARISTQFSLIENLFIETFNRR